MEDLPPPYDANAPAKPPPYSPQPAAAGPSPQPPPVGFQVSNPQPSGTTPTIVNVAPVPSQVVVVQSTWSCPACKQMGFITEGFTLCGICLAIWFFPLGIICCLMMKVKRCSNCRAVII